jgi:hypothetical protein
MYFSLLKFFTYENFDATTIIWTQRVLKIIDMNFDVWHSKKLLVEFS